jgi:hypothetical protein
VFVSDAANPGMPVLLELHQIPGTACYARQRVSSGMDTLPAAERIQVEAVLTEGADTTRSLVSLGTSSMGPRWVEIRGRHILTFKPLRTTVWLISGKLVLPRSHPWQRVLIGSTTAELDSATSECGMVVKEYECFAFQTLASEIPAAKAFLLGSDNDRHTIPMDGSGRLPHAKASPSAICRLSDFHPPEVSDLHPPLTEALDDARERRMTARGGLMH